MRPKAKDLMKDILLDHLGRMWSLDVKTMTLLTGGTESAAWVIEENSNGNKWVAKLFGLGEDLIKVKDEVNLYQFLIDHGIHAPVLTADLNNQKLNFIDFKGYQFPVILMRFEDLRMCTPSTVTQDVLTKIASETAKMHKILLGYPNKEILKNKQLPAEKGAEKDEPKSAYEALVQSVHLKKFSKEQLKKFAEVDSKMEEFIKTHTPSLPLTESIIHADLALEHVQLLPDGNVYFFDFADRSWGAVAQELATFMTMLYQWEDIAFQKWEELSQWLLNGYQTVTPLTSNDLQAIPQKALIRLLGACKYLAVLAKNTPSGHVVNWIRRGYELGDYICLKEL